METVAPQAAANPEAARVRLLYALMAECKMCPRECGVRRLRGEHGVCRSGVRPVVASATLHYGEEPPLTGRGGSGAVFFSGCGLKCVFCQNFPISQLGVGNEMTVQKVARRMLALQKEGAENINFVTPTHFAAQAAHAVFLARRQGMTLPVVYNSSGYESVRTLRLLEGFVDVYLCDYRYATPALAGKFSGAPDYPLIVEEAIEEMLRQTGNFDGRRGVIVRHLCLPGHLEETRKVLGRIRERFGKAMTISLMNQYFPAHKSRRHREINRRLSRFERQQTWEMLNECGLENGWTQV
jgi:putative pyruvate formate lyase activating enzyme